MDKILSIVFVLAIISFAKSIIGAGEIRGSYQTFF